MSARRARVDRVAAWAGIVGSSAIGLGSVVAAVAYRGADGESYSPLNHFVSELGELSQSQLAIIFNLSVIVGGVCFVVFMGGLAASGPGRLGVLAGVVGVIAGLGGAFVGILPMDVGAPHVLAASTFFNFGWIAVGLASVGFVIVPDPRFPRWLAVVGLITVAAFIAFLREVPANTTASGGLASPDIRPDLWAFPALEWLTIVGIVGWVLLVSASWLRGGHRVVGEPESKGLVGPTGQPEGGPG